MKLMEGFDSNYRYVLVAARRARQLQAGAPNLVASKSAKPQQIAQEEIQAGKVPYIIPDPEKSAAEVAREQLERAFGEK